MKTLNNKYKKWYYALIESRKSLVRDNEYTENHHIIPRCLGGSNSVNNIVALTPREHYIAHMLLYKMTEGSEKSKMGYAFNMMLVTSSDHEYRYTPPSVLYAMTRLAFSKAISINNKGNKAWNKGVPRTAEEKALMSERRLENNKIRQLNNQPTCWNKGVQRTTEEKALMSARRKSENKKRREQNKPTTWNDGEKDIIVKCPHCNTSGGRSTMKRWHFDQCLDNPNNINPKERVTNFTKNNPSKILKECPHCKTKAGGGNYARWHGDNCKKKRNDNDSN